VSFDSAAIQTMMSNVVSHAQQLGIFEYVTTHEPKSTFLAGMYLGVWVQSIEPIKASGLDATSGRVELFARIYTSFIQKPEDNIDPDILTACCTLIGAFTGDFDFGGTLRMVDLLGAYGNPLSARAGYVTIAQKLYRVMTLTVPLIFNDMFIQVE
jgi:hypothetical protein